jgi:3-deoxy-D-manno-octulosonate 8-phosphate phosphatase (KDO 8-P phosphatase)
MKKLIAHRGNTNGCKPEHENTVNYLNQAMAYSHFDVECDVRYINGELFLGHDKPQQKIDLRYLMNDQIWVHCKDTASFNYLKNYSVQCFYQDKDLISPVYNTKYTWLHENHSRLEVGSNSIITALNVFNPNYLKNPNIVGICSDFISHYKQYDVKPKIKLIVIDVDGVMSKNKIYDKEGGCTHKEFCDKDFTAIKMFKAAGAKVCFLSGDNWNRRLAENRKIDFVYSSRNDGIIDKTARMYEIFEKYKIEDISEVVYIGDDYYDLDVLKILEHSYCPNDANPVLYRYSNRLNTKSGDGVIWELYEVLRCRINSILYPGDNL